MADYPFYLSTPYTWSSGLPVREAKSFFDQKGKERLRIDKDGMITIPAYAWDGCSPTFRLFDWAYWGTPNGTQQSDGFPKTYYPSLVHDALYQFRKHPSMPYSRKQMDQLFLKALKQQDFSLSSVYYGSVRLLGGAYNNVTRWRQRRKER